MPTVGKKKFAYNAKGKKAAKEEEEKLRLARARNRRSGASASKRGSYA